MESAVLLILVLLFLFLGVPVAISLGLPALIIVDPVRWTASLIDTLAGLRARPFFVSCQGLPCQAVRCKTRRRLSNSPRST